MTQQTIRIGGARQHNLQNLSLTLPRGPVGGRHRAERFGQEQPRLSTPSTPRAVGVTWRASSAYARQFLDQLGEARRGLHRGSVPRHRARTAHRGSGNPRSTIATTTEIYDYLRLLYASVGQPHDPATGRPLRRQTPQAIVDQILALEPNAHG